MNILISNDDGIQARGIWELVKALRESTGADIYVSAPDGQRSAASHAISLRSNMKVKELPFENAVTAFAVDGTPADCVVVGLKILEDRGINIDLVFSGINHGGNVGTDVIYSGTVGAALEGTIQGKPSVAVSVDSHSAEHFEYACKLACDVVKKTGGSWDREIMLNINTPNLPADEIKGVKYTVVGEREYNNDIVIESEEDGVLTFSYGGEPVFYENLPDTIDVVALQNGYATITPLQRDMTAHGAMAKLDEWRIGEND